MFVKNEPAMKISEYLVVSDLHLGITGDIWRSGVSLPSQARSLAKRLNHLKAVTRTKYLIINGDMKHKITGISSQERREIPEFLSLLKFSKVVIIKGNHDGGLEKLVKGIKGVTVKKSILLGQYRIKTAKKIIVVGHNHLVIKFQDDVKALYTEQVWLRGRAGGKTIIIMPAFNELSGHYAVNKGSFQGPIASKLTSSARVYLLDGTDLGRVKDVRLRE